MDKFIVKNPENNNGLEFIGNCIIENKKDEKKNIQLQTFKQILYSKIDKFNPSKMNNNEIDNTIQLLWYNYVFNELTQEQIDSLGISITR